MKTLRIILSAIGLVFIFSKIALTMFMVVVGFLNITKDYGNFKGNKDNYTSADAHRAKEDCRSIINIIGDM